VFDSVALESRLSRVRERIARAVSRAKRDPASVRLIAVSKTFSSEYVRAAADAGQLDFGENKVQEGLAKIAQTSDLPLRWHLIGHLQSNKLRQAIAFHAIDSMDASTLVQKVETAALSAGRTVDVLIQVDLAREATKYGIQPDDLRSALDVAVACKAVRLKGLMLLPPAFDDPEGARPYFAALRTLRDDLVHEGRDPSTLAELSMGMSHDFEVAIEEGATQVRVGSAIFGARTNQMSE
jgi:pyridoxal phosphate enzyme (YggS family)